MLPKNNKQKNSLTELTESIYLDNSNLKKIDAMPLETNVAPSVGHSTTDFLLARLAALASFVGQIPKNKALSAISEGERFYILENLSQASIVIKESLTSSSEVGRSKNNQAILRHSKIKVGCPINSVLAVTLPPLISKKYSGSYDIYWDTKRAIEEYFLTNEKPTLTGKKLILIYKKYAPNLSTDYTCDNDNWEAKRTTNAISEGLNHSDNSEHFSMMYTAVRYQNSFVEALVIEADKLYLFTDYIVDETPIQPL